MKTEKVEISLIDANEYAKGNYYRDKSKIDEAKGSDIVKISISLVSEHPKEVEKEIASWSSIRYSKTIYSQEEPEITPDHFAGRYKTDYQIAGLVGVAAALPKLLPKETLEKLKNSSTVEFNESDNIIQEIENCEYFFTREPFIYRIVQQSRDGFSSTKTTYSRGHEFKVWVHKK